MAESQSGFVEEGVFYGMMPVGYPRCLKAIEAFLTGHDLQHGVTGDSPPLRVRRCQIRLQGVTRESVIISLRTPQGIMLFFVMTTDPDYPYYLALSQAGIDRSRQVEPEG